MCGIAGFAGSGDKSVLATMTVRLSHRGPDGSGLYADQSDSVFLGHRRLAVIDLDGGTQPMWNEDGQVGIVFNGEIYNHLEIRAELARRGHVFASDHSDTEVLIHGYEEWGEQLLPKLNGMFAFAVFDRRQRCLFLARDRFGEKPLFWAEKNGTFIFASELSALTAHPLLSRVPSIVSLQKFLAYGYLPAPNALYEGTSKLPAGHWLRFELGNRSVTVRRYWNFELEPAEGLTDADEPRLIEELRHLLKQATHRRLMAEVPIGIFLSGGLDSSAVLASAIDGKNPSEISTFTIGFREKSFDESPYARAVAEHFGTRHHEQICDIDAGRTLMAETLPRLDEPLGDPSIIPTHMLSRFTREHVTVALSGDGGDELLAGYDPMLAIAPANIYYRIIPRGLHELLRFGANKLPISTRNMSLDFKIRRTLMGLSYPPCVWGPVWMSPLDPGRLGDLFGCRLRIEDLYSEAIEVWESTGGDPVNKMLAFFTNLYLQDNILVKTDRASMLSSLESRAVFLDNDLVDFCRRLPNRFKLRNGQRKYLLRKALQGLLPPEILNRPKKGFGVPVADWLRTTPAEPPMAPIAGVQTEVAARIWSDHRSKRADERLFLWSWLSLQSTLASINPPSSPIEAA